MNTVPAKGGTTLTPIVATVTHTSLTIDNHPAKTETPDGWEPEVYEALITGKISYRQATAAMQK